MRLGHLRGNGRGLDRGHRFQPGPRRVAEVGVEAGFSKLIVEGEGEGEGWALGVTHGNGIAAQLTWGHVAHTLTHRRDDSLVLARRDLRVCGEDRTCRGTERYQQDPGIVYQETYAVITATYRILRESESRGFIETGWADVTDNLGTQWKQRVNVEVTRGACVRVVLRMDGRSLNPSTSKWTTATDMRGAEDNLYLQIHRRVGQARAATAPPPAPPQQPTASPQPTTAKPPGTEGGVCYGNATCDGTLACASSLCVQLPGR